MKTIRPFALAFYVPLLVSGLLFYTVLVSPKFIAPSPNVEFKAEVSVLGIKIPLAVWLKKVWILRSLLIAGAIVSLTRALAVDFSRHFPTRLSMDVYFDEKGIERNLKVFSAKELNELSLAPDWKQHIGTYMELVKSSLLTLWRQRHLKDTPDIGDLTRDMVHARGETTFIVKRFGLFSYRIAESLGRLDYDLDVPKKPRRSFCSVFELRETASNHIRVDLGEVVKSASIILKPEFKQIFAMEAGGQQAPFDHIVVGLTKAFLLPFPHFTGTIYLWKLQSGQTVPIGYCLYAADSGA